MKRIYIGELEHQIYKIVQRQGEVTVREIFESFKMSKKYTTIMTVMNRMVSKGELLRTKNGLRFVYILNKESESKSSSLLKRIKDSLFEGRTKSMVSYLLEEDKEISRGELEEIEKVIASLKARS